MREEINDYIRDSFTNNDDDNCYICGFIMTELEILLVVIVVTMGIITLVTSFTFFLVIKRIFQLKTMINEYYSLINSLREDLDDYYENICCRLSQHYKKIISIEQCVFSIEQCVSRYKTCGEVINEVNEKPVMKPELTGTSKAPRAYSPKTQSANTGMPILCINCLHHGDGLCKRRKMDLVMGTVKSANMDCKLERLVGNDNCGPEGMFFSRKK